MFENVWYGICYSEDATMDQRSTFLLHFTFLQYFFDPWMPPPPVTSRRLPLPWRHRGSNEGSFSFTPLQYVRMMLIFTKRWRLHYGRNPCRLWFDALFKYSSFSNRPSHAKGNLKSKTIWTSNWLLQETVKDILPLGRNSFTISY